MIESYKDFEVYKKSYELVKEMMQLTKTYPDEERFEIVSQIRRAALSIPLNIAEGYGKKQSAAEFKRFLIMSLGSVNEIEVLLDISCDLEYITEEKHRELLERYQVLGKQLNTLIQRWQ
jgi:four helix bundle protein